MHGSHCRPFIVYWEHTCSQSWIVRTYRYGVNIIENLPVLYGNEQCLDILFVVVFLMFGLFTFIYYIAAIITTLILDLIENKYSLFQTVSKTIINTQNYISNSSQGSIEWIFN